MKKMTAYLKSVYIVAYKCSALCVFNNDYVNLCFIINAFGFAIIIARTGF